MASAPVRLRRVDDAVDAEVTLRRGARADVDGLVRLADVARIAIAVGVDRHGRDPHLAARAQHADGDLSPVGDEDFHAAPWHCICSAALCGLPLPCAHTMRSMARSKVAADLSRERLRRIAALSPADRIALAERLGEESVTAHMAAHAVDRRTAMAQIKATRRLGRRRSRSAE